MIYDYGLSVTRSAQDQPLTSRGFVVDAGVAGAVFPRAATVAMGGAAEVGGGRVTGGGAAVL